MPIRDLLIEEASSAILEPISQQMTYTILTHLGLRAAFGDNVYITNDYTKPSLTSDENHNALISKDRCDVKMTVAWNPSDTKWDINAFKYTQAYGTFPGLDRDLVPVFFDPVADVRLTEHQLPCSMALEFSLQFKNRESAFATISVINNTSLKDSVINTHILSYSYPISEDMLASLHQLYTLRQSSTALDFWTYLQKYSKGAVQYLQQRTGRRIELVIKRQDIRAIGVLDYNQTAPTVQEQDRGIDRFVVEFTYTLQFARPDVLRLAFPVAICNKPVPAQMVRQDDRDVLDALCGVFQDRSVTGYLRANGERPPPVVRRPTYDDFRPPQQPVVAAGFQEFFTAALYLDDAPTTTIDLLALGDDMHLHETVVTLMKQHGAAIFDTAGLLNVALYCNGLPVDRSCLSIDANLVVTLAMRNQTRRYHLVLSEATNLKSLAGEWYDTLIAYRTFFPITVIRNLQSLISRQYCYIDEHNELLRLINYEIRQLTIDAQIRTLIAGAHLTHYAYSYATTAEQFADYLMQHRSPVTHRLVYDEYVRLCIETGLLNEGQLATGYLRTTGGYPFLSGNLRGTTSTFNLPLRVVSATVDIATTPT